ncbi:MAG: lipid-A-disaccharide synthase [Candidatus Omnitrophica bacterium]|nr:lipid-A-disaccharide synthase [Candidatus Omnitrophota bacterium]
MSLAHPNIFISVGEESADLHASRLCAELKNLHPSMTLYGFGGQKMSGAGVEILYPLPELALIGFIEVAKHLPQIYKIKSLAVKTWKERRPDAVLLVDYPGFHLRLAQEARRMGIPVLYYIAPQAWAWREKRVEVMRKIIDHLFVIFPFEESFFNKRGVKTTYTGHPLIDRIPPFESNPTTRASLSEPLIGLMPGSRRNELRHILPTLLQAASLLKERRPGCRFILPLADALPESILQAYRIPEWVEICRDINYQKRREITFAWTASGTATVENALLGVPMVVVYRTNRLNMFIGRRLVRIPYIGMVNLIAEKGICPEFIQEQCQPDALARCADELLDNPNRYQEMIDDLACVRRKIGAQPASRRAAEAISQFLTVHF